MKVSPKILRPIAVALLTGMLILTATMAHAHKVTVFAWVEGDTIHTESKFSGGKLVQGGKIEVFDQQGNKLLEGTTDERGGFSFPVPLRAELKIVLVAGSGHSNHWIVRAEELGGGMAGDASPAPAKSQEQTAAGSADVSVCACPDTRQIERIVQLSLDQKLAPLKAQLADPAWGLRDILGGVGYILGLMGLASYIHYRKQAARKA
jgi:nickel transport protein